MELRRICKHNYAILSVPLFCLSAWDYLFKAIIYGDFYNRHKILLDI